MSETVPDVERQLAGAYASLEGWRKFLIETVKLAEELEEATSRRNASDGSANRKQY